MDQEFIWDEAKEEAFQELKAMLSSTPILKWPIQGWSFKLHTDWNTIRLGAVLTQLDDDGWKFVGAYATQSNNKTKANYNSYEVKYLVIVWVVSSFWCYFHGSPFTLIIDH
jgi:hypothetical protein